MVGGGVPMSRWNAHTHTYACRHVRTNTYTLGQHQKRSLGRQLIRFLVGSAVAAGLQQTQQQQPGAGGGGGGGAVGGRGGDRGQLYQTSAVARMSEWAAWEADSLPPPSFLVHDLAAPATRGWGTGTAGRRQQERETEV